MVRTSMTAIIQQTQLFVHRKITTVVVGYFGDKWWKDNLRMTRGTFAMLVIQLRPLIEKRDTHYEKSCPS